MLQACGSYENLPAADSSNEIPNMYPSKHEHARMVFGMKAKIRGSSKSALTQPLTKQITIPIISNQGQLERLVIMHRWVLSMARCKH
jgi:hypothetical protein